MCILFGWTVLPHVVPAMQAEQIRSVVTQLHTQVLNNPEYLSLRNQTAVSLTNQTSVVPTQFSDPTPPLHVVAFDQKVGGIITLTWEYPLGEDFIASEVYRSTPDTPDFLLAEHITGLTYTDTTAQTGTSYTYFIVGVGSRAGGAVRSGPSEAVTAVATDSTAPHAPEDVVALNTGTGKSITLTWHNPTEADFAGVRVYRSQHLGTLGSIIAEGLMTETYEDVHIPDNNTRYYYTITSVDTIGNESSTELSTTTPGNPDPFHVLFQ